MLIMLHKNTQYSGTSFYHIFFSSEGSHLVIKLLTVC